MKTRMQFHTNTFPISYAPHQEAARSHYETVNIPCWWCSLIPKNDTASCRCQCCSSFRKRCITCPKDGKAVALSQIPEIWNLNTCCIPSTTGNTIAECWTNPHIAELQSTFLLLFSHTHTEKNIQVQIPRNWVEDTSVSWSTRTHNTLSHCVSFPEQKHEKHRMYVKWKLQAPRYIMIPDIL